MSRMGFRIVTATVMVLAVLVGWVYSAAAWDTGSGGDPAWGSVTLGGTSTDYGFGVAVDSSGNVYTTGYFFGTVDFGAGNVTSVGNSDVFVTKLNASGVHQWTTTFGGTSVDYGYGVAVDSSGNVYATGNFQRTVDFGAGNVTSAGVADVFVTKLNASGVHQWTTTFGGTSNDYGFGVAVDSSGNVYTTGHFQGTVNFGAGNVTSAGSADVFVTKLNASGVHQWTTKFGGTSADYGYGVAVDSSGNVYATGYFQGTVNFGAGNVTSAGSADVFVTKLNASGVHQWTTTLGGTNADVGYGVAVDSSGNVYATGYFIGTVNFGAGNVTSAGDVDVFVTKLNASGAHQWTTTFGGTSADDGYGVAVDSSGNVYATGEFQGTVNFGAGNVTSAGSDDVFVVKLNSAGQVCVSCGWNTASGGDPAWGSVTLGGTSADDGYGVAVDSSGNVYTIGEFSGGVNFGA